MLRNFCFIILVSIFSLNASAQTKYKTFSPSEINMITEADSSKSMRVLQITNYVDSVFLRMPSLAVKPDPNDTLLLSFVNRLYKTVRDPNSLGVGIAAPQVGIPRRIIWVQRFDKEEEQFPFEVYLNPEITTYSDTTKLTMEGCLSIPDFRSEVKRPCSITIEYDQLDGTHRRETISGFTSVIFQHEIDHLNGILYLDHLKKEVYDQRKKEQKE
jgi:peptide deformylase